MATSADKEAAAEAIKHLSKLAALPQVFSGKVKAVNEAECTCEVLLTADDNLDTQDMYSANILVSAEAENNNGVIVLPAIGSHVWVCEIDGPGMLGIVKTSNVSKHTVKIGDTPELVIEEGKIVMNGGSNGGIPKAGTVADRLKRLEDKLNDFITIVSAWTAVPNDGGAALKAALLGTLPPGANWLVPIAPTTSTGDLENTNVKH